MKQVFVVVLLLPLIGWAQQENFRSQQNGITVIGYAENPEFADARVVLDQTLFFSQERIDSGKNTFKFQIDNYQLGAQTPDAGTKLCANSAKGQHLHVILDNGPYTASYSNEVSTTIKPGHHVLLAFLSRSYHMSLKHKKAFAIKEFDCGKGKWVDSFNANGPQLFYSRPKGDYIGEKEVRRILLDFYLLNANLSEKGMKVRATINGTAFLLTRWEPYFIEGLPLGENRIKLELIDSRGRLVKCAFNGVERTIKLITEPLKP
ncbi:MAG: hypothetical protein U0T84_10080 [Chitinophagales bacterium]